MEWNAMPAPVSLACAQHRINPHTAYGLAPLDSCSPPLQFHLHGRYAPSDVLPTGPQTCMALPLTRARRTPVTCLTRHSGVSILSVRKGGVRAFAPRGVRECHMHAGGAAPVGSFGFTALEPCVLAQLLK